MTQPQTEETPKDSTMIEGLVSNFMDKFNHDFDNGNGKVEEDISTMEESMSWMLKVFANSLTESVTRLTEERVRKEINGGDYSTISAREWYLRGRNEAPGSCSRDHKKILFDSEKGCPICNLRHATELLNQKPPQSDG